MSQLNGTWDRGDFVIREAINATLSASPASANVIVPVTGYKGISLVEAFNESGGALVADLALEISNDYDPMRTHLTAHWDPVTDPSIIAWLTTDASASPKGGKPAGIQGTGSLQITDLNFAAFRFTVTRTAGTGLYLLAVKLSGTGRR